ncbi:hypothetical protein SEA_JEGGS_28 [Arthrobacter phage JEGGS]|uniref:Uncharacterized protein n=2 Tax=Mudcatvirus TaxID=1982088 RepID=A0A222Z6Z1_9CAUD|nr:hypothetical protein PQB79_gp028 [Arthrobacter phage Heisenberger]YP_010666607.1 hypothetical protein PQB80_gp028 [Arthrobacter phage JEGGS]ASR80282.1 hypothetical protein SEA_HEISENBERGER_28 [Arthrobacter phage Heisenberger]QDM57511.1 hypothetical protein SEA_JEGGS_28 [Arthrobacter phage JEGGS]
MFKNPLSTKEDLTELVGEIRKEDIDVDKLKKIRNKILLKKTAQGVLIGIVTGTAYYLLKEAMHVELTEEDLAEDEDY